MAIPEEGPRDAPHEHDRTTRALLCPEAVHQEESAPPRCIVGECPDARLKERIGSVHKRLLRLAGVSASFMLVATALAVAKPPVTLAATHVVNPWFGAVQYANPAYATEVNPYIQAQTAAGTTQGKQLAAAATTVENQSTAFWLDSRDSLLGQNGKTGLVTYLNGALALQGNSATNAPVVVTLVVYDLPGRDCGATGSAVSDWQPAWDDPAAHAADIDAYKSTFITPIMSTIGEQKYQYLRFAMIIEPDAIGNILTNQYQNPYGTSLIMSQNCAADVSIYEQGIAYALSQFRMANDAYYKNIYSFLDITNSAWESWRIDDTRQNEPDAGSEYKKIVKMAGDESQPTTLGYNTVDGFVSNISSYAPVQENFPNQYMVGSTIDANGKVIGGTSVNSAPFYSVGQRDVDELSFVNDMRTELINYGGFPPSTLNFAIDTSRNGWGGPLRPNIYRFPGSLIPGTLPTNVTDFVKGRWDERLSSSNWCNQSGAGIGVRPMAISATPALVTGSLQYIDAFLWVKTPGESDGSSNAGPGYDPMCDPLLINPTKFVNTGALANTPAAGQFNNAQFTELLTNAYDSLGVFTPPGQPGSPSASGSGTASLSVPGPTSSSVLADRNPRAQTRLAALAAPYHGGPTSSSVLAAPAYGVTVSWLAPDSTGGSPILSYTVTASNGQTCTTGPTQMYCLVSGLPSGTYTFTVKATNAIGTGPASVPTAPVTVTAATKPGAPTNVTASWSAGLYVSWTPPANNGGSAITGYTVTSSPSAGSCTTGSSQNFCSWMSPNFTPGTIYTFTVTATNAVGTGPASSPSNGVTPPLAAPWPPVGLSVVAGNGQATLRWVAPPSNGGSAITGYTVTASPGGRTCTTTGLSCTVTGLTNGTSYTLTVTARNSVGTSGGASTSVTPVATTTAPGAPTNVTGTAGNASATINWVAPASNGGSAITGYTVTASSGGRTCTTTGALTCTVTGLTNGTSYTFTVKATNAVGSSVASAAVTVKPVAAGTATCSATVSTTSTWMSGTNGYGQVSVSVKAGSVSITSWTVTIVWPKTMTIAGTASSGTVTGSGTKTFTVKNVSYNGSLSAGASTTSNPGFQVYGSGAYAAPTTVTCSAT